MFLLPEATQMKKVMLHNAPPLLLLFQHCSTLFFPSYFLFCLSALHMCQRVL